MSTANISTKGDQMIEQRIRHWLKGRKAPMGFNEDQREALLAEIIGIVEKAAPQEDVSAWVGQVIERAMMRQKGLGWPSPDVWAIAVGGARKPVRPAQPDGQRSALRSEADRVASRINENQIVGENALFGKVADLMLFEALVTLSQLRRYQIAAFNERQAMYGPEKAMRWAYSKNENFGDAMQREAKPSQNYWNETDREGDTNERAE